MSGERPTILVVDDDRDACQNLFEILADLGYRVDVAHDGPSALRMAGEKAYDIALLDLKMPGMDGLTLYRELKRLRSGTVAMLVTAFASEETAAEAISAGAWRVVRKPVDFPGLLDLIEEAVGQPLVLVVDDDRELCSNLWDILRARGYRVCLAHNPSEAREQLASSHYRVVLIDMKLPGGDGGEVFQHVQDVDPKARTIVITGARDELSRQIDMLIKLGLDAVHYKPLDLASFLTTLDELAGNSSGREGM